MSFAYDWLGRQFAVDQARQTEGEPLVLLIEPATGDVYDVPDTLVAFHDEELVDYPDETVERTFFESWSQSPGARLPLRGDQCVGYRVPFFLGGDHDLDNLEVTDLGVYWSLSSQLWAACEELPEGTRITNISIGG